MRYADVFPAHNELMITTVYMLTETDMTDLRPWSPSVAVVADLLLGEALGGYGILVARVVDRITGKAWVLAPEPQEKRESAVWPRGK